MVKKHSVVQFPHRARTLTQTNEKVPHTQNKKKYNKKYMAQNHLIMQRVLFSFKRQRIKDTLQQNAQKEKKKLNTHTSRFLCRRH